MQLTELQQKVYDLKKEGKTVSEIANILGKYNAQIYQIVNLLKSRERNESDTTRI